MEKEVFGISELVRRREVEMKKFYISLLGESDRIVSAKDIEQVKDYAKKCFDENTHPIIRSATEEDVSRYHLVGGRIHNI
jgi:hypothetical protein